MIYMALLALLCMQEKNKLGPCNGENIRWFYPSPYLSYIYIKQIVNKSFLVQFEMEQSQPHSSVLLPAVRVLATLQQHTVLCTTTGHAVTTTHSSLYYHGSCCPQQHTVLCTTTGHAVLMELITCICSQGKTVGEFTKDRFPGDFMTAWRSELDSESLEKVSYISSQQQL